MMTGPVGPDQARRLARQELAKPEYRQGGPSVVQRVLDWIGDHLGTAFGGHTGGSQAFLLVLAVIVAVLVLVALRAGRPGRRAHGHRDGDEDPLAPQAARDHRRVALELTAQGRRPEALREWLRAAVQTIEDRGVLPPSPGRTGATTAREAGPRLPSVAGDLDVAMRAFDEVWFGGRPASDEDVASARRAADGVASARIARPAGQTTPDGIAAPW